MTFLRLSLALWTLIGFGCGEDPAPQDQERGPVQSKITVLDPQGQIVFEMKRTDRRYKLQAKTEPLGELKLREDRIKLKSDVDELRGTLKQKKDSFELEDEVNLRRFRLRLKGDRWTLENRQETVLAEVKDKTTSLELRDANGVTLLKAKPKEGKVDLESETGERLYRVKGTEDALAALWLGCDAFDMTPLERAAFCAAFIEFR